MSRARVAAAGAVAATVWGVLENVDRRLLRHDYSDVAILGKLATRGRGWRVAGFAWHAANGASFALAWHELSRRRPTSPVALALLEHVALFPLGALVDRRHPARGTDGVGTIFHERAFAQATLRHAYFGWLVGRLAR